MDNDKIDKDILEEIPDEDLPLLSNLYKKYESVAPQAYSLLNTSIAWKQKKPNSKYLTYFGVKNDWLRSGTFILLMQFNCHDLFVFTLEEDCKTLRKALTQTKKIDFSKKILWYAVASRHTPTVMDVIKELNISLHHTTATGLWVIEKSKALQFEIECPDDVYIKKLDKSHAAIVNTHWPHKYEGSEGYLSTFIEMNNAYGIFLKANDKLVCWVLKSYLGQLVILQTLDEYKRKGYAALVTKFMSKEIAQEGHDPLGTVIVENKASEVMFKRLGFRSIDICTFIGTFKYSYSYDIKKI